jgi:hypothetical protein
MSLTMKACSARSLVNLFPSVALVSVLGLLGGAGCSDDGTNGSSSTAGTAGVSAVAGSSTTAGTGGSASAGTSGSATGGGGAGQLTGGAGTAGTTSPGGAAGMGGALGGAGGSAAGTSGAAGMNSSGGSVNTLPADYKGTPYTALKIPGRINAADYDRGGAGVAWCHDMGNCKAGTVTGDYPQASGVYRAPMPANAMLCSGAACDDNVGVCRMNPSKPDNTIMGQPMPATDTYLCYSIAGEWTKYTVVVEQAGTYSVGGVMAVPQGGAFNLSFGAAITTGNVPVAITPTTNSGSGENYHSWDTRSGLATITFPAAGSYLMTFTQVGRFNADAFTFAKM